MNEHIFVIGKNEKEYNYKQLTNILGNPVFEKYKLDELLQYSAVKLNKIIKTERKIIPSSRWRNDERIIIILWGHESKCNHFKTDENGILTSLCKNDPSKDDSSKENGRCALMGGSKKSTSKRKTGGNTSSNMQGNDHSLKSGLFSSGKSMIPKEQFNLFNELREQDELQRLKNRLAFLESQLIFITNTVGIEHINEFEANCYC